MNSISIVFWIVLIINLIELTICHDRYHDFHYDKERDNHHHHHHHHHNPNHQRPHHPSPNDHTNPHHKHNHHENIKRKQAKYFILLIY